MKQLITAVGVAYERTENNRVLPHVVGEVFYMRKTAILRRNVRKVVFRHTMPLNGNHANIIKPAMRKILDLLVRRYYANGGKWDKVTQELIALN